MIILIDFALVLDILDMKLNKLFILSRPRSRSIVS